MQTSEWVFPLDFHWMWCWVQHIHCASHHGSLAHIQAFVNKAMTQREAKPQEGSTRDQQESVKTGGTGKLSTSRQVKHTYMHGWTVQKAQESWAGLLSPASLAFFHSCSSHILALLPGCAVGRLLGAVNTACSAAPTPTIPQQDGTGRHPAGRTGLKGQSQV